MSKIDMGVIARKSVIVPVGLPVINNAASETRCVVILAMNLSPAFLGEGIALSVCARDVLDLIVEIVVFSSILTCEY